MQGKRPGRRVSRAQGQSSRKKKVDVELSHRFQSPSSWQRRGSHPERYQSLSAVGGAIRPPQPPFSAGLIVALLEKVSPRTGSNVTTRHPPPITPPPFNHANPPSITPPPFNHAPPRFLICTTAMHLASPSLGVHLANILNMLQICLPWNGIGKHLVIVACLGSRVKGVTQDAEDLV